MTSIEIRRVTIADIPAVRVALIEAWHATYDDIYGPDKVRDITTRWHSLVALAAQVDQAGSAFLMAEQNGRIAASAFASEIEPGLVHLFRLYVRPALQTRGIGHALMRETFAVFVAAKRFRLEVEPRNHRAIAFYRRAGFVQIATTSDCGGDSNVAALVLERGASWFRQPAPAASP
jgi:ribosomal protein S18 acetylase RimI-like enzyme